MAAETQEITREDLLMLTLHQDLASWLEVEPMDYQHYINQLLPCEVDDNIIIALRHVDIEIQCLLAAITKELDRTHADYDGNSGTALTQIIIALRTGSYAYAARVKKLKSSAVLFLSIRRQANQAWWCESEPDKQTMLLETLKGLVG